MQFDLSFIPFLRSDNSSTGREINKDFCSSNPELYSGSLSFCFKKQFIKYLPQWVIDLLRLFKAQLKSKSSAQFILLFIIALAANLLATIAFMIVLLGFNIDALTFRGLMAFEAAYLATSLVPIAPGGIGVREGSRVYFFALLGYNQAAVLCASFIIYALNIMLPAVIGIGSMKYFWKTDPDHS